MAAWDYTEDIIRRNSTPQSFERGWSYFHNGAVAALARRGDTLAADVEGSADEPYRVRVTFGAKGIAAADCTCEYEWGGWCKHVVAALLAARETPEEIEERPELPKLLSQLDAGQLRNVLLKLIERDPRLADVIETQVALVAASKPAAAGAAAPGAPATVDPTPFRRQMRALIRDVERGWEDDYYEGSIGEATGGLLEQVWSFIRAGDGRNSLAMLDAMTDEYMKEWSDLQDFGEDETFLTAAGRAWAEAILSADLTPQERPPLVQKLTAWQEAVEDFGEDGPFAAAIAAAEQGWDDPALQRILAGGRPDDQGEPPEYADALTAARLNVLERQGRLEEYLNLAAAERQTRQYLIMLVRLGRESEAVAQGPRVLTTAADALALAAALQQAGHAAAAVRIGEHGLTLSGDAFDLAVWLSEHAAGAGRPDVALHAARTAFDHELDLPSYLRVQELADDAWEHHRAGMLDQLRQRKSFYPQGHVDIFLHEGLLDDAIAIVDGGAAPNLVEQVVDAAITEQPLWTIAQCQKQAAGIMNEGKAQHYETAVRWLSKAKRAYAAAGRQDEWRAYLNGLLQAHARKYKLKPMLETLR